MIRVGSFIAGAVGATQPDTQSPAEYEYPFYVEFRYRDGTLKKGIYIGSNDNPIVSLKFSLNQSGPANGSIELAYIDWTVDRLDLVFVYYKGEKIYCGFVEDLPDLDGGEISVAPMRELLAKTLFEKKQYQGNKYAGDILTETIQDKTDQHRIMFNPERISAEFTGKDQTPLVAPSFEDGDYESVISQLVNQIDSDAVWGADVSNVFFVTYPDTETTKTLYQGENPDFEEAEVSENFENIKCTRAVVYRAGDTDNGEAEDVRCGTVCYPGDSVYPNQAELEQKAGIIEDVISISTVLVTVDTSTAAKREACIDQANRLALQYAFNKIKSQQAEKTVKLKNVNLDRFIPRCGQRVKIVKNYNSKILWTLADCETLSRWSGNSVSLDDTHIMHGRHSVRHGIDMISDDSDWTQCAKYSLPSWGILFDGIEFLEFYVYTEMTFGYLNVRVFGTESTAEHTFGGSGSFEPRETIKHFEMTPGWHRCVMPVTHGIQDIRFRLHYGASADDYVFIDSIKAYSYAEQIYEGNITEAEYSIENSGAACDVTIGNYDYMVNDTLQYLEWKIKEIDNIRKIT